ncbi:MAG: hypothetical protein HQM16_04835 [Deltaproteobacteria bacterium]|nr:hypothetical protein [Deltaproteobacteria bacterium]
MKETLLSLLKLAEIDGRINKLKDEQDEIPRQVKDDSQDIITRQDLIEKTSRDITEKELTKKTLTDFIQEKNQWVTSREDLVKDIKTNKEYQAALKEVATAKKEIKDKETALQGLVPDLEAKVTELAKIKDENTPIIDTLKSKILQYKLRFEDLKLELAKTRQERSEAKKNITNKDILNYYEKIHTRIEPAIAKVDNNCICTECGTHLLPQTYNLVAVGKEIQTCNGCKRIIYIEEILAEAG